MKRAATAIFFALLISGTLFAGGRGEKSVPKENDSPVVEFSGKKLVVGLDDSFPPFAFRDEQNRISGYDVELAKEAARRMGLEPELAPVDWLYKEEALNSGEIDCIWSGLASGGAGGAGSGGAAPFFTAPYLADSRVIVVRVDSPARRPEDLAGKSAGTRAGPDEAGGPGAVLEFRNSLKALITYRDFPTAFTDLEMGGIDAVICGRLFAADYIRRFRKPFRILDESLAREELVIAFRGSDRALAGKLWSTLLEMAADGTVGKLSLEWLGADASLIID